MSMIRTMPEPSPLHPPAAPALNPPNPQTLQVVVTAFDGFLYVIDGVQVQQGLIGVQGWFWLDILCVSSTAAACRCGSGGGLVVAPPPPRRTTTTTTTTANRAPSPTRRCRTPARSLMTMVMLCAAVALHACHAPVLQACADTVDLGENSYAAVLADDLDGDGLLELLVTTMNGNV